MTIYDYLSKSASKKPYRDRAEVYALKGDQVYGGLYDHGGFGVFGGGVDPGETPADAAAREFAEEAGWTINNVKPLPFKPMTFEWKPPYGSEKQRERARQFRGSRTYYMTGDLGEPIPGAVIDPHEQEHRTDSRLYGLQEALGLAKPPLDSTSLIAANKRRAAILKYLIQQTGKKTAALYHGSSVGDLKSIDPRPSRVLGGAEGVFATPRKEMALSFGQSWTDDDFEQGTVNGQPYMREKSPESFERVYGNKPGFIYEVPEKGFAPDPRLAKFEQLSGQAVSPTKVKQIKNLLEALKKTKMLMLRHGEQAPWEKEATTADAYIIKGNPDVMGDQLPAYDRFYNRIAKTLKAQGLSTEFDAGLPHTTPPDDAKLWIGHSRGADRLRFAPPNVKTLRLDDFEAEAERKRNEAFLTARGVKSWAEVPVAERPVPGKGHRTITPQMRAALQGLLAQLSKS